jgi:anti-sigma B factor antagonist
VRSRNYYIADCRLSEVTYRVGAGGELDLAAQPELVRSLARAKGSGAETVHLDLTKVSFIDSTAIKAIAITGREILARGGRVDVSIGNRHVMKVFEVTGLDRLFELNFVLLVEELVR